MRRPLDVQQHRVAVVVDRAAVAAAGRAGLRRVGARPDRLVAREQAVEDRPRHADARDRAAVRALVAPVARAAERAAGRRTPAGRGTARRPGSRRRRRRARSTRSGCRRTGCRSPGAARRGRRSRRRRPSSSVPDDRAVGEDEALHGQDRVLLVLAVPRRPDLRLVARVLVQDPAGALAVERDQAAAVEDDVGLVVEDLGGRGHRDRRPGRARSRT